MSWEYSENILVQNSAGNLLQDELGWDVQFEKADGLAESLSDFEQNLFESFDKGLCPLRSCQWDKACGGWKERNSCKYIKIEEEGVDY